jgi:hypothetical protein
MPGHLFVVQSDLTRIACDAWLLPTGRSLQIRNHWLRGAPASLLKLVTDSDHACDNDPETRDTWFFDGKLKVPVGWVVRENRSFEISGWAPDLAPNRPWATSIVVDWRWSSEMKAEWIAEGARQFVERAATALKMSGQHPANGRLRHLLALPVVGTGHGGGWDAAGVIIRQLVRVLSDELQKHDVDVVIVTKTPDQLAAVQQARRDCFAADPLTAFRGLSPELRSEGRKLADRSINGKLVLFLGAGASVGAGLPTWTTLLKLLAADAKLDAPTQKALSELPVLDQARIIGDRLHQRTAQEGEAVRTLSQAILKHVVANRFSLTHAFLANLDITESVTTNYDTLFEDASEAAGHKTAVLPYGSASGTDRWLLKMHGCVNFPEDIVLTREDFMRYAYRRGALAGIVQALLITRHMLFVGFSLTDENFQRIADQVRKVVRLPSASGSSAPSEPFGTALLVAPSPLLGELWTGDIACISLTDDTREAGELTAAQKSARRREGAAQLELLLDYVVYEANQRVSHLLDERYDGLLSQSEAALRQLLLNMQATATPDMKALPAWKPVGDMLKSLGGGPNVPVSR